MRILIASIAAGTGVLAASAATAQSQPQQTAQASPPVATAAAADPVICEKQEVTGSRLATRKVCMKRSQWQDQQLQERQTIERAQINHGLPPG